MLQRLVSCSECQELLQGIPHLIFVEGISCKQDGQDLEGWAAVQEAIQHAALIVTEIMPTPPYTTWKKVNLVERT